MKHLLYKTFIYFVIKLIKLIKQAYYLAIRSPFYLISKILSSLFCKKLTYSEV